VSNNKSSFLRDMGVVVVAIAIGAPIIWLALCLTSQYEKNIERKVMSNPVHTKGVIVDRRLYKGRGVYVEYYASP